MLEDDCHPRGRMGRYEDAAKFWACPHVMAEEKGSAWGNRMVECKDEKGRPLAWATEIARATRVR